MAYNHRLASVVWDRGAFWNHQPTEAFHSICSWTAGRVSIWRLNIFKTRAIGKVLYLDGNSNGNIRITCLILEKSTSLIGFFHGVPSVSAPFLEKTLMWATKHTWTYIETLIPGMWKWAGVLDPKTWQTTWSHDENNPQGGVCGAPPVMWRLVNPMNTIVGGNWNSQYIPILLPSFNPVKKLVDPKKHKSFKPATSWSPNWMPRSSSGCKSRSHSRPDISVPMIPVRIKNVAWDQGLAWIFGAWHVMFFQNMF